MKPDYKAFAIEVMEQWPNVAPGLEELHQSAVKHGLIKPDPKVVPCGDPCQCKDYYNYGETSPCYKRQW